jgi:uroporphyrin-III C-methyltransferase/precorrin-2 dehydrogenase/sirohydrochlorin ferrochelatase
MSGFVSLVGAGPGSPDLLTLKAARRLREADLVLYDGLVDPRILRLARKAHRFHVGKRVGRKSIQQETIHALMIRAARRGQRVVRLKCGDPFVLGRGGEEALALAQAGIAFEVVPGVSSAVAAPALSGIPVTHRGIASGFAVISGHSEAAFRPILDSLAPNSMTVVVLMGLATRARLAELLLEVGWRAGTPVAINFAASTSRSYTWLGSLRELAFTEVPDELADAPGVICIGEVISVAAELAQYAKTERPSRVTAS